jgi:hypothetical protein
MAGGENYIAEHDVPERMILQAKPARNQLMQELDRTSLCERTDLGVVE